MARRLAVALTVEDGVAGLIGEVPESVVRRPMDHALEEALGALPGWKPLSVFEWPLPPAIQLIIRACSDGQLEFVEQRVLLLR